MSTTPNQQEPAAVNFCQNCGKPLMAAEVRTVGGMIYCEPCLAQRLGIPVSGAGQATPGAAMPGAPYAAPFPPPAYIPVRNSPVLAALLGFIPGVGAMYNGQVAKGLVHVLVFIALVKATDLNDLFGLLIAFWVFYQVFDAYQTASALQRGLPVPDPLGLNQIAGKFGFPQATHPTPPPYAGYPPPPPAAGPVEYPTYPPYPTSPAPTAQPVPESSMPGTSMIVQPMEYVPPPLPPVDFAPGFVPGQVSGQPDVPGQRSLPMGAIVLIALGMFFLLGTVGVLSTHWLSRGWPVILIALGVYVGAKNFHGGR